jgi:hypothetical protein
MRKRKAIPNSREWAMGIVSFACSRDATRYNLAGFNLELNRVLATDGCRLAWQEYGPAEKPTAGSTAITTAAIA